MKGAVIVRTVLGRRRLARFAHFGQTCAFILVEFRPSAPHIQKAWPGIVKTGHVAGGGIGLAKPVVTPHLEKPGRETTEP